MRVNWTPEAVDTFKQIIENLNVYWTQKEINIFIEQTELIIRYIQQNPYLYKSTSKNKQVRKGFVNRLVSMFYKVNFDNKEIEIITFWNNRQDPKKNKFD